MENKNQNIKELIKDHRWYGFMSTDNWIVFMNMMRMATLILVVFLIWLMTTNIEQIKLLASDPCQICMNKTGANCYKLVG